MRTSACGLSDSPRRAPGPGGRSLALACLALATLVGANAELVAQATALRGEVLLRDGRPATNVRLLIVGHPPEVALQDGGLFTHSLSGSPTEVTVRTIGEPDAEVLFPPGGRLVIPGDSLSVVSVLVGERIGVAVEERIDRDLKELRETLEVRGVSEEEIEAVIRAELDGLVTRIAALTEGAVESAVTGAAQTELRERINRYLGTYVRRTRDLVDAFDLVDVSRQMTLSESLVLRDAIGNYSDAYGDLDREMSEVPAALARAWPGDAGRALRERMNEVLELIRSNVHQEMLHLRGPLVVIQLEFTPERPRRDEVRSAREAVTATIPRLASALDRLEAEVPPLMEGLRGPESP